MTTATGQINTYVDTTLAKRVLTNRMLAQDPYEIATLEALGMDLGKFSFNGPLSTKYEWVEMSYPDVTDVASDELTSATTTTQFTPDDPGLYSVGQVIKIDSELLWVSAISAAGVLTVTRGYGATTPATHANDSVIYIVSQARLEGADADDNAKMVKSTGYNYTQIFQRTLEISGSKMVQPQEAGYDPWDTEIDGAMNYLMMLLNRLPYYGKRLVGAANTPRSAGGLYEFITSNVTAMSSAVLTAKAVEDLLEDIYIAGGDPDLVLVNPWIRRKLTDIYGRDRFYTEPSNKYEGFRIEYFENPIAGRPLRVVVDRTTPAGTLNILSSQEVGFIPYRDFSFEELAKTGDAKKAEIVGEYGFVVANQMHHGYLSGISTTK